MHPPGRPEVTELSRAAKARSERNRGKSGQTGEYPLFVSSRTPKARPSKPQKITSQADRWIEAERDVRAMIFEAHAKTAPWLRGADCLYRDVRPL